MTTDLQDYIPDVWLQEYQGNTHTMNLKQEFKKKNNITFKYRLVSLDRVNPQQM